MKAKIYSIYKATNRVNGKVYIGFDSNWPRRMTAHRSSSFNPNSPSYKVYFHQAIRKYGWQAFDWECIYQSADREHVFGEMENYFIAEYQSFGREGYNSTYGGRGTFGAKHSAEHKSDINRWVADRTEFEFISERGDRFIGRTVDLQKAYPEDDIECSEIRKLVRGRQLSCKGWRLATPIRECKPRGQQEMHYFGHETHGLARCRRGDLLKRYPEIDPSDLTALISGKRWSVKGFYMSDAEGTMLKREANGVRLSHDPRTKATIYTITHKTSGRTFTGTQNEACRKFGFDVSTFTKLTKGKLKTMKGWRLRGETHD